MRFGSMATAEQYASGLAQGDDGLWYAACEQAGALITVRCRPGPSARVMDAHQQVLIEATALLIYGLAFHRQTAPAALSAQDLLGWLDTHAPVRHWRDALATLLQAAGHDAPFEHCGRHWLVDDPVLATWTRTVHEDDHVPTIDGTYGLYLENGLQGLVALLRLPQDSGS
jgi:hypothetical protein